MPDDPIPFGYKTFSGRVLSRVDVVYYNQLTKEINRLEAGKGSKVRIEALRDERHKIINGLITSGQSEEKDV